jgi:hypothetical protein
MVPGATSDRRTFETRFKEHSKTHKNNEVRNNEASFFSNPSTQAIAVRLKISKSFTLSQKAKN